MNSEHDRFLSYYHDTKNQLFNYLMARLSFDKSLAEDLLMDVVLKAYENFHKFDEAKGAFKTWIFTLAHNHLVNFWRDNKKTVSLEKLEDIGVMPAQVEIDEETGQQIENQKIQHILSMMNDKEREIIVLRYIEDLEYSEMAKVLGKKEGAIRTGLSRALKHFKEIYKKFYS